MIRLIQGDALEVLRTLEAGSVQCCVTSPPYWGLRDYGVEGQMGLEETPEEYVAKMVKVFREVRRVLRDDGTLWLNLGMSYASSSTRGSGDSDPIQSPLLWRGPACGKDGTESQGSQADGHACRGFCDEPQGGIPNRHAGTSRSGQSEPQDGPPISQIAHDSEPGDCAQASQGVSVPAALASNTRASFRRDRAACAPSAKASVSPKKRPTSSFDALSCDDTKACTRGTSPMSPPLVVRTVGKESFYSACHSPDCRGIGRCGLCWCRLAIPSLNVKAKDEINIPHLVAMALQADGWVLRQTIIWHKPNPMPESVTDRCTKAHEYIFLLSKRPRYYFDSEAMREPGVYPKGTFAAKGSVTRHKMPYVNGRPPEYKEYTGFRNRRSVWTVQSKPFPEAHFATFPPDLIQPCIEAGCPVGGTVLDPFCGSGTVPLLCQKLDRRCIGIELNEEYHAMSQRRVDEGVDMLTGIDNGKDGAQ